MILSESLKINNKILRNRIVMPPMATRKAENGGPSHEQIEYYKKRAVGTGLIIVEHAYVSPEGMASIGQLSMADDSIISAYQKLTDAVHQEGALILAQISHAGAYAKTMGEKIAPSAYAFKDGMDLPKEMTKDDIKRIVKCFADASIRAKKAGFDGVEIHSAHGYLLTQFYSPLTNKRADEYGFQNLESRTKIHREIIRAIRESAGSNFILALRFGGCDYMEGGSKIEDIPKASTIFEDEGIDLLDISGGLCAYTLKENDNPGWFSDSSKAAKSAVNIPVILTGGIKTKEDAEKFLIDGSCDLVGIGREMMKNPNWSKEALA